ncbi:MAG: MaoC family dehydratase [Acidimicrobiales bacterium]|nr:MaoC family dehydratase [Acidimicrobiales bacterium]
MSENAERVAEVLRARIGAEPVAGDWFQMTQERVNQFADATLDHQFIHIDPEKAAATPFGGTIAHGFLTLSLLVKLSESIHPEPAIDYTGLLMGVNYGMNKVRFINPVPTDARIRATATTIDIAVKGGSVDETRLMTVEIEGAEKPALIAEWIGRLVFG